MTETAGVFAERCLQLRSTDGTKDILVQLGPIIRKDGAAFCRYKLTGFNEEISREIWGVDDIQAMQLALAMAGSDLNRLGGDGKFSIEGDPNREAGHGFPILA